MNQDIPNLHQAHSALAASFNTDHNNKHSHHSAHHHHNRPHANTQATEHDKSTRSVSVIEGKQLILECNAFGYPKPIINWYVKRFKSENLTGIIQIFSLIIIENLLNRLFFSVFNLNSSKVFVSNVMQKQYDYFECEASNRVPPAISRKFKINVMCKKKQKFQTGINEI
jgi:hypothetical protein